MLQRTSSIAILSDVETEDVVEDVEGAVARRQQLEHLAELLRHLFVVDEQVAAHHDDHPPPGGGLAVDGHNLVLHLLEGQTLELLQDGGGPLELPRTVAAVLEVEHGDVILWCGCGEKKAGRERGFGVITWVNNKYA